MMRRWLWLVAVACLGIPYSHASAAPAQSPSCVVTPGRSIGTLNLGAARDELMRLWGTPDRTEPTKAGGQWMEFRLLRLGAVALNAEGRVVFVAVSDDPCMKTVEGLSTGDQRARVRAVYGEPSQTVAESFSDIVVKKKYRLRIGTSFKDFHLDVYPNRGLGIVSAQTMHLNGYTSDGTPIVVPIDPEPMVDTFTVEVARQQAMIFSAR